MSERADALKAVCFTFWLPDHNNVRYAALFPGLASLVRFHKVTFSRYRWIRGAQFRLWRGLDRQLIYPLASHRLAKRHRVLFTVDPRQIPSWKANVVADVDDPTYDAAEISLLKLPQVETIVVTTEKAKRMYEDLDIHKVIHVIPQGVSARFDPARAGRIRHQFRKDSEVVVGYLAPTLTLSRDGPGRWREGLDDLDYLLSAVEEARLAEPRIKLWLLGRPSPSLREYADERPWIRLFDFVPLPEILDHLSNFDVAVYPRKPMLPPGWSTIKMAQYMACGVPVVATRVSEALVVNEVGNGIVCDSREEFSQALQSLARSPETRAKLGTAGRQYARANLDWSQLISRYESIIGEVLEKAR